MSREDYRGVWFDDIRRFDVGIGNEALQAVQVGLRFGYGNTIARNVDPPVMGRVTSLSLWGTVKPLQQLTMSPEVTLQKLRNRDTRELIYEGVILRLRANYQITRELFVRTVIQFNEFADDLSIEPLITYRVNPYTVFYIGSTHNYAWELFDSHCPEKSARQFFFKFQYLLRT